MVPDFVRIGSMAAQADEIPTEGPTAGGVIRPDPSHPGPGLECKRQDAERFAA